MIPIILKGKSYISDGSIERAYSMKKITEVGKCLLAFQDIFSLE